MAECNDKSYFEDDYVMNHYKCLRIHFETTVTELRDPIYPINAPDHQNASISSPKTVPFSYGARSVRIKKNEGVTGAAKVKLG